MFAQKILAQTKLCPSDMQRVAIHMTSYYVRKTPDASCQGQ